MSRKFMIGVAPDSFKGSLTALEAASCIERGLKRALVNLAVRKIPMADGGEGTVRALVEATGGRLVRCKVQDPLGRAVRAEFGVTGDGKSAVIEMAAASGMALLKPSERNPMVTTTYGTGQMIKAALDRKVHKIVVGIGGSATNDGGTGMARALGARFLDKAGKALPEGGGALRSLDSVDVSGLDPRIEKVDIEVACDVDNPLYGPKGAARVYAPQKGASPAMVAKLDRGLRRLASVVRRDLDLDISEVPGSGAAGGLGAGLMAFTGGVLRPGIDIVIDTVRLKRRLRGCRLIVTGEGRMDGQTAYGKAPAGVARVAKELGLPVIAISGSLGDEVSRVRSVGIDAYFSALEQSVDEMELSRRGPDMLERCAEEVGRLLALRFSGRAGLKART